MTKAQWADKVALISARLEERKALGNEILKNPESVSYTHLTLPTICSV